jgi:hypothetical protein
MADETAPALPGASDLQTDLGADFPPIYTTLITSPPGYTSIGLPAAGTLWVVAEGDTPNSLYLHHQGGTTEQVPMDTPGSFQVQAGDALVYQFTEPNPNFKLVWGYA